MVTAAGGSEVLGRAGERSEAVTWARVHASGPEVVIVAPCGFRLEARSALQRDSWTAARCRRASRSGPLTPAPSWCGRGLASLRVARCSPPSCTRTAAEGPTWQKPVGWPDLTASRSWRPPGRDEPPWCAGLLRRRSRRPPPTGAASTPPCPGARRTRRGEPRRSRCVRHLHTRPTCG